MDFTPNPEQQAVADVVSTVLDRENTWEALVSGGVTALGVPDRLGGDGVGLPEIATALAAHGRSSWAEAHPIDTTRSPAQSVADALNICRAT